MCYLPTSVIVLTNVDGRSNVFANLHLTYISYQPNFSDTESDTFLIPNFIDTHWSLDHWQKIISSEKYNDIGC